MKVTRIVAWSAAAVALVGCASPTAQRATEFRDSATVVEAGEGVGAFDLDAATLPVVAGAIALGTVTGETERLEAGATDVGEGEPYTSLRDLSFQVEEVVAGEVRAEDTIVIADAVGWKYEPVQGVRFEIVEEGARLRPGDRVLVVLTPEPASDPGRYLLITESSYLFLDGEDVVDTGREGELLGELERRSRDGAVAMLKEICGDGCDRTTFPHYGEDGRLE